ncbi:hypothetical protein D5S17_33930 [Pseudonocardiaceae bacterium YIM PH 21723]|nr:hypothetical protein D5S17_33930 [Pseudonocardiaceae bacterium YIM PH 21723]
MLLVVVALILVSFGFMVAVLITGTSLFAWISVGVSLLAFTLLVTEWILTRRRRRAESDQAKIITAEQAAEATAERPAVPEDGEADPEDPGEEDTDAADALLIPQIDAEVRVVDEYPRYHLARCPWLSGRETLPLQLSEARELGFTPCDRCRPDANLATLARAQHPKATALEDYPED